MKAKPTPTGGLTTPAKFHRFGKSFETRVDALSAKPPLTSPRSTTNERRQANVGGEARRRVRVFWPEEDAWFAGFVGSYDPETKKHTVYYDDGEIERIVLADEKVEWLEQEPAADGSGSSPATPSLLGLKALQAMGARVREEDVTETVTEEQAKAGGGFYRTKAGKLRCGRCRSCVIKSYTRPCFMLLRPDEKEARAGRRVSVLWPDENRRFTGVIDGYHADDDVHTIAYDDGTVEHHVLADEDVHFIEPNGVVLRPIRMLAAEKKRVAKRRVAVFWPLEKTWFTGIVDARDAETKQHTIVYDDGEVERIEMVKEKVKWLDWLEPVSGDEPKDLEPVRSPPLETPCDVTNRLDGIREPRNVPETIRVEEDSDDERDDHPLATRPFKETRSTGGAVVAGLPDGRLTPAVSLKTLVESGHIQAGKRKLWVSYMNRTWSASLGADGVIKFEGEDFHSPSAWAVFCKRIAKPGKKTDDGWKSIRCGYPEGPSLEDIRKAYTESAAVSYRSERERSDEDVDVPVAKKQKHGKNSHERVHAEKQKKQKKASAPAALAVAVPSAPSAPSNDAAIFDRVALLEEKLDELRGVVAAQAVELAELRAVKATSSTVWRPNVRKDHVPA
jgi:hypothetical protein